MSRAKLARYAANAASQNVLEPGKELFGQLKGKWGAEIFRNDHPIVLEIGCGRGEYTIGLAAQYPEKNFLGIDIKGSRIWKGSQVAQEQGLHNVAFLRTYVQLLTEHIAPDEVNEIWLTFPDPRPRNVDIRRRLTNPRFLNMYRSMLKPGGIVHLKTDSASLFDYTVGVLREWGIVPAHCTYDLYASADADVVLGIKTTYEKRYLAQGLPIHYLSFSFPAAAAPAEVMSEPVQQA